MDAILRDGNFLNNNKRLVDPKHHPNLSLFIY